MNHKDLDVWKSAMLLAEVIYVETLIILSNKVGYFNDEKQEKLLALVTQCSKLTHGLI